MTATVLSHAQRLKIDLLATGLRIDRRARLRLTDAGEVPLTVPEYPTTGGLTLVISESIYVNAPADDALFAATEAVLLYDDGAASFVIQSHGTDFPVRVLKLPGYLDTKDSYGRTVTDSVFSHADRVRVSPFGGCTFTCTFCDIPGKPYVARPIDQLLEGLAVAYADQDLPVHHVLISGGTPAPKDYSYFDSVCERIVRGTQRPVDVMMPPRPRDPDFIDRLVSYGVHGFAINLELFGGASAANITPQKHKIGLDLFGRTIERAVELTGGKGRVRSLILVGLDPEENTLRGVRFLAQRGCDPVLSPFRPSTGTKLEDHPAPSFRSLEDVYLRALEIVERHGVKLGPRCIPCQHNTLSFPDGTSDYWYSSGLQRVPSQRSAVSRPMA